jgi:hypothetical protein
VRNRGIGYQGHGDLGIVLGELGGGLDAGQSTDHGDGERSRESPHSEPEQVGLFELGQGEGVFGSPRGVVASVGAADRVDQVVVGQELTIAQHDRAGPRVDPPDGSHAQLHLGGEYLLECDCGVRASGGELVEPDAFDEHGEGIDDDHPRIPAP